MRLQPPDRGASCVSAVADGQWCQYQSGFGRMRARYGGETGPIPEQMVVSAESTFRELLSTAPSTPVLLHGDLHHGNILSTQHGWLAIDPKGIIGENSAEKFQKESYTTVVGFPFCEARR